jgi:hypothetical protein
MPQRITRADYDRRLDELCDQYRDGTTPALARQLNESLAEFKAGVVIVETVPAARRVTRPVRETAQARPTSRRAVSKPAGLSKREQRIVTETVSAAMTPKPAAGTTPEKVLQSPFWRGLRESAPATAITESEAAEIAESERDIADLAKLDSDGFNAVCAYLGKKRRGLSPLGATR